MNTPQDYLEDQISNNWKSFPWKLDYMIYLLFSHDKGIIDFMLKTHNDIYKVLSYRNKKGDYSLLDNDLYKNFIVDKNELLSFLNINKYKNNDSVSFSYTTQIFNNIYHFRGQKSLLISGDNVITLRLLSNEDGFGNFNNKVEKYTLAHYLNQNLSNDDKKTESKTKI